MAILREQLAELPLDFDGADKLQKLALKTLRDYLDPASDELLKVAIASDFFLQLEQERLEALVKGTDGVEGPQHGEAQS